jgi:hypothetical protein
MFTYSQWLVDFLAKAAGHKYIKRVPYVSGGKRRYRYIYKVTHMAGGKHVLDPEHMVQGAAFMLSSAKGSEIHAHITKVDGDVVTYRLDDGPRKGELVTESKSKLAERLNAEHGVHEALAGAREKQAKVVADLRAGGASEKHVAREQARLDRLNAATPAPAPKSEEPKKRATKKPESDELEPAPDYWGDEGHDMWVAYTETYGRTASPPRKESIEIVEGGARVKTEKRTVDVNTGKGTEQMELVTFPQLSTEHMVLGLVPSGTEYNLKFTVLTGAQKGAGVQVMSLDNDATSVALSTRAKQVVYGMMQMGMEDALAQFDPSNRDTYPALQNVLKAVKASDLLSQAQFGSTPSIKEVAHARQFARAFARGDDAAIPPALKAPKLERSVTELEELRAKVFTRKDLWQMSDDELNDVVKFAKKKHAEFKDDARGYLALRKELERAETRMGRALRARNDEEYARAAVEASNIKNDLDDDDDGRRAYDAYNEYVDSELRARQELDHRKAARAN